MNNFIDSPFNEYYKFFEVLRANFTLGIGLFEFFMIF